MKKWLCLFCVILSITFITACSKYTTYEEVSFDTVIEMLENKQSFILFIGSSNCSHCATYEPKLNSVIKEYQVKVYFIDVNKLSETENSVKAAQNIFLSPAQKMYKAGIFEQTGFADELTQAHFNAYLFDNQFNKGIRLAEYFYKDFLGLTIEGNSEVQTKMFYDFFSNAIATVYKEDVDVRNECFNLLQAEMNNQERSIDSSEVIRRIVPEGQRDEFISKVGSRFPNPFLKDRQLLQRKLSNKSMYLTSSIRILAPAISFDNDIITICDDENDPTIKIVRIRTQAVNNEEH